MDHKNSPLPRGKIGEGISAFLCNESVKHRVSGERSKGYSFARAVMYQVVRINSDEIVNPFVSPFGALGSGRRSQVCPIIEMVEAAAMPYRG
jgi:hypothetical protein